MRGVIWKSVLVTLGVIAVSQIVSFASRMAAGQDFTAFVFLMNSILPTVTALPASILIFRQNALLRDAHAQLAIAHAALAEKATRDGLTGLLNREAFLGQLESMDVTNVRSALMIIDADNFKVVNDTYGHAEGDVALRLISNAIASAAGSGGLAGRLGGEEFAVFLPGATHRRALAVSEQIRSAVASLEFHPVRNLTHPLSVSVGMSLTGTGLSLHHYLRHADANLYLAKRQGRNAVVFRPDAA